MAAYFDQDNPLVDEEFAETRRRQRWQLAAIPDWVIPRMRPERAKLGVDLETEPRRTLLERGLRDLADEQAEKVATFLSDAIKASGVRLVPDFLTAQTAGTHQLNQAERDVMDAFDPLRSEMADEWRSATVGEPNPADEPALRRLIALLAWADELADDGYRDTRLDQEYESS